MKTLEIADGRVELRAVTGSDYDRIFDHERVLTVQRIVGNGTGDTRCKVPGVLDCPLLRLSCFTPYYLHPAKDREINAVV